MSFQKVRYAWKMSAWMGMATLGFTNSGFSQNTPALKTYLSLASHGVCIATHREAYGPVTELTNKGALVHYTFPKVPARFQHGAPIEPWVFELVVDLDGRLCSLKLLSGTDDTFAQSLATAVQKWSFAPFITRVGPACYRTSIYFYVRSRARHMVVDAPGITSLIE